MKTIETVKAKEETPEQITRRKQLFRLVIGPLPPAWQKAYAAWEKSYAVRSAAAESAESAAEKKNAAIFLKWIRKARA
jgi:hypothetical protein